MPFTIAAANDLLVEYDSERWSLLLPSAPATPIVEASAQVLRYASAFAIARRLGSLEALSPDQVSMVVVGYSSEDRNWHLGLMLDASVAQGRGGRWCELAQWPEDEEMDAENAGRKLSAVIARPFRLVTPQPSPANLTYSSSASSTAQHVDTWAVDAQQTQSQFPTAAAPSSSGVFAPAATVPARPEVTVQPLPLSFGDWTTQEILGGMQWNRTKKWRNDQIVRGLFFCALAPIFGLLAVGALLSPYATVQPLWLPWVGVALALIMLLIGLSAFFAISRSPTTTIDRRTQMLRQNRGGRQKVVQSPFEGLEYVLISHSISRQQTIDDQLMLAILDVWVHVYSPRRGFILICTTDNVEAQIQRKLTFDVRRPLSLNEIDSLAHHAALHMARDIGIPAFVEER